MAAKDYIGKLVVVAHWPDFDLRDATKLGLLREVKDGYYYIENDSRGYRHIKPVGKKIPNRKPRGDNK